MSEAKTKTAAPAPSPEPAQPDHQGRKRILLVEGDGFTRLVLLLRLRLAGFGVDFTSNGSLGLGKLRNCHPDVLLVELKLCGLSGLELIKSARAQPSFGDRPIFVFTHASRINRATRKELEALEVKVMDKAAITREDLVQIFSNTFPGPEPVTKATEAAANPQAQPPALSEVVVSGAIEELIAGVKEQADLFVREKGPRIASGTELLSRVSSLASCAKAAGLADLSRHVKALENFIAQLCKNEHPYTDTELDTVTRAVEVMSRISHERKGKAQNLTRFAAVFIDESPYSNRAMEEALLTAGFAPVCFEDPARARGSLGANRTDLIIANLALPEAHGLALTNVRQMSLHDATPIIYAPEFLGATPHSDDVPGRAPRLDRAPLLLAELVVKALNEVQSGGAASAAQPVAGSKRKSAVGHANAMAAALPGEDSVELFAQKPRREMASTVSQAAATGAVFAGPVQNNAAFSHLFTASGIPSEPILRAEPARNGEDLQAEIVAGVPEAPVEFSQAELQVVETPTPSALQTRALPVQPEQISEDPMSAVPQAEGEVGLTMLAARAEPELPDQFVRSEQNLEAPPTNGESMNNRFETSADWSQSAVNTQAGDAPSEGSQPHPDLAARVCAAEMALYHAQAEVEERGKTIEALQKQIEQANQGAPAAPADSEEGKAQKRCAELEQEVSALRQAFENLNSGFAEATSKQTPEADAALAARAAELEKAQEQQKAIEAELRQQLEGVSSADQQNQAARQQAEARCAELEQELKKLQETAKAAPKQSEASGDRNDSAPAGDLEQQVRQGVAALAKATAELARERGERQRSHQLATDLNARLQVLHQDCNRTLQAQGENLSRITALEQQHTQAAQALERCQADLEQQQAERLLAETQVQKAKEANAQLRKDLSFFEATNTKFGNSRQDLQNRLEARLNAARENEAKLQHEIAERQKVADNLDETRRELQAQMRQREALQKELESTREILRERESKLEKETAERQRLNEAQGSLQSDSQDGQERELEFSKLQAALQNEQIERKRQETQLAQTRQRALDAAHAARSLRTSLRRQIREPVENLAQSARTLLELEMGEEQKKLAESVLQDVLLVQTRLREPGNTPVDSSETPRTS